ncbi:MAG: DUF333 domain-containing protein [archaeon]
MKPQIAVILAVLFISGILALSGCVSKGNNNPQPIVKGNDKNADLNSAGNPSSPPDNNSSIANPASVYCLQQGGKLEIRKDANENEFGVCVFPNGSECEEWSYFRGECRQTKETKRAADCNLLAGSETGKIINLFFLPTYRASQDEIAQQSSHVRDLANQLFQIKPFSSNQDKFNFYFLSISPEFNCDIGSENCNVDDIAKLVKDQCGVSDENLHQIVVFHSNAVSGGGKRGANKLGYGNIFLDENGSGIILAHELGHSMAGFGDEYFTGDVRGTVQNTSNNKDFEGCPKWCSGTLDESNQFYTYYAGWKSCVLSKGLDLNPKKITVVHPGESAGENESWNSCWNEWAEKYYNAANSQEFVDYCPYNPPAPQLKNGFPQVSIGAVKFSCDDANRFENLNLGKGCIENTGCYFTAFGVNEWRQLQDSIMRSKTAEGLEKINAVSFGAYSEKVLRDTINDLVK